MQVLSTFKNVLEFFRDLAKNLKNNLKFYWTRGFGRRCSRCSPLPLHFSSTCAGGLTDHICKRHDGGDGIRNAEKISIFCKELSNSFEFLKKLLKCNRGLIQTQKECLRIIFKCQKSFRISYFAIENRGNLS